LQSAYTLRWGPEIASVVKDLSRQVSSFNNLQEFFSALRLDGDFIIEDTASSKNMYTNTNKIKSESSEDYAGPSATIWVMTMHAAKGLEFDEVVLPFWNEGNVPKNNSPEERRLAFVSLTRARNKVLISNAKTRAVTKQLLKPSSLITELLDLKYSHISFEEVHQSPIDNRIEQPPRYDYQSTIGAELKERPPSLSKSVALNRPTKNSLSSPLSTSQLTQSIPTPPVTSSRPSTSNSFSSPSPSSSMHHPYSREGDLRTALFDQVGTPVNSISKIIGRYNDLNKNHDIITPPSTPEQEKAKKGKQKTASSNDDNKVKKATNKSSKQTTTKTKTRSTTTTSKLTTTELTDINNLTSTEVKNLLTTKSVSKQILKLYFKEALSTRFGIKRGSISINNDTNKVISKCTVEELGQYLYSMIKKDEQ